MRKKLSIVLATLNEEKNIGPCLDTVKGITDEMIVVDEGSTDKTREIAQSKGARVFKVKHESIFHKTKQKALDKATGDWILQLDADERVTKTLAKEITDTINGNPHKINNRKQKLFARHQKAVEARDGKIGKEKGEVVAYFVSRLNFFLGKPLIHAGVYPDPAVRLIKRGKANFPAKSVHEQMTVDGRVGWLSSHMNHHDSPSMHRYVARLNRYTDLQASELDNVKTSKNIFTLLWYSFPKPLINFILLYVRHAGFKDGMRGFLWSLLSSLHFPIAYYKYYSSNE